MKRGKLADNFVGIGMKRLGPSDAEPTTSNQHEVGTTKQMRQDFLGEEHTEKFETTYMWLGAEKEAHTCHGTTTHYDTRSKSPTRAPEWRLYYKSNPVTEIMSPGDTLFLAKTTDGKLLFIVAVQGSVGERQLFQLFGLQPEDIHFVSKEFKHTAPELDFAARYLLSELGVEFGESDTDILDKTIAQFKNQFPTVAEFSKATRNSLPDIDPVGDPDTALLAWLERETALFYHLERRILAEDIQPGFIKDGGVDVERFLSLSNSVMNRRKARMGHSLENQVEAMLLANGLNFDRGALTEDRHRPDFLFPGIKEYNISPAEDPRFVMLGAKSTCKDRWRQVLSEASKIPNKHLITLETSISENQTTQMRDARLNLVVPAGLHSTFTNVQQQWLLSVRDFIEMVREKQRHV